MKTALVETTFYFSFSLPVQIPIIIYESLSIIFWVGVDRGDFGGLRDSKTRGYCLIFCWYNFNWWCQIANLRIGWVLLPNSTQWGWNRRYPRYKTLMQKFNRIFAVLGKDSKWRALTNVRVAKITWRNLKKTNSELKN